MFGTGFKASKCKTVVRLALSRIKLLRNKRDIQVKQMRRDIAQLLQTGQEPCARIRAEHVIREQNTIDAYDIIELFCEVVVARLPILEAQKLCPMDMKEAVSSLIYVAPRAADLPELLQLRSLFATKYGKEFIAAASELRPDCGVNRRIIAKLSLGTPSGEERLNLLKAIATEFKLEWEPVDTLAGLLKKPEDLLDGPKCFTGASELPSSDVLENDKEFILPKSTWTNPFQSEKKISSIVHAKTSVLTRPEVDLHNDSHSDKRKQLVSSVSQKHEHFKSSTSQTRTPQQASSLPTKIVSGVSICQKVGIDELGEKSYSFKGVGSREAYRDFAFAVHAAAESAEQAAAAARTAASLANMTLRRNV